jgi:hypothetical protein
MQIAADIERTQFTTKPIGPLGEHITIRDQKYGMYWSFFRLIAVVSSKYLCSSHSCI